MPSIICPRCKSKEVFLVRFAGVNCLVCPLCHYDERNMFEGFYGENEKHIELPL